MKSTRIIVFTWLVWLFIVIAFQAWASSRINPQWPDHALSWTTFETGVNYEKGQKYLLDPFLNDQVAWDSEYYLAIAVGGYSDPATDLVGPPELGMTKSYAFFPMYPLLIRLLAAPLAIFGLTPIATATLAGVIVSALGALGGMLALHNLTYHQAGEQVALRAAFYLIIFPTAFFMVQVYTEGLFVGLAFGCLAMLKQRRWLLASLLAACLTMTRAVGIVIMIPMLITWIRSRDWLDLDMDWHQIVITGFPRRSLFNASLILLPLIVFLLWKFSFYGQAFDYVEANFFGNNFMALGQAYRLWVEAFQSLSWEIPQRAANYSAIIALFALSLFASLKCRTAYPEVAWFSIVLLLVSWGSGPASGMHRYALTAPAVFIMLAEWGENPIIDRSWTIISLLWMGIYAAVFALGMWVA